MRGSSGSFGIVTSIEVATYAAPAFATVFTYIWDLSAADAAKALLQFQNFVQTNIPQEFAAEVDVEKGSTNGRVAISLVGGYYADPNLFASVIAPFLNNLPQPASETVTPGSYIESVQFFGGLNRLNTTGIADTHDTFYAKSLMTPESSPMTLEALTAFMNYAGNQGYSADTVR